ncbi:MAG: hypothetical protein AVDCRST_MAG89-3678 [uncultured Gemmatimonadetes bacterium]|uniref:Uncharacterized protein n=1 Tax=uncultured Gemmatimonadota bacterium TaxID=203437 RepID=A0A6J4MKI4_9BACT|nr:MAG: hypothetical protein AVDCRST_MAG89-3678 [uncultured Gemmatimonadota bacterium]
MDIDDIDLSEFRAMWARSREATAAFRARTNPEGMTRPPRDPDERAFLEERGMLGPFVEMDMPGWREWIERKHTPPVEDDAEG